MNVIATPSVNVGTRTLSLTVSLQETDTTLKNRYVSGNIDWGDGSRYVLFKTTATTNNAHSYGTITHAYKDKGLYLITVSGQNYRAPTPDTDVYYYQLDLTDQNVPDTATDKILFGPIVPKDTGFPNADQWMLNNGSDLEVIISGIKVLLLTAKGERLCDPSLGTSIRKSLFESADSPFGDKLIQEEIVSGIGQNFPTVSVLSVSIKRSLTRADVDVVCLAKGKKQPFQLNVAFER